MITKKNETAKAFIPQSLLFRFGIISGITTDIAEQELTTNINSSVQIASVRDIMRKEEDYLKPTLSVEIQFLGNFLSQSINILWIGMSSFTHRKKTETVIKMYSFRTRQTNLQK